MRQESGNQSAKGHAKTFKLSSESNEELLMGFKQTPWQCLDPLL